jgi:hypothetical protein
MRLTSWAVVLLLGSCKQDNEIVRRSHIDTFYQNPTDQVDVLWVIDNSLSMNDEQAEVADKFTRFIEGLESSQLDFHIGVVTTDMESATGRGQLIGEPSYLTPETPDYQALFEERVLVGIDGSDREKGIDAAYTALTEPLRSGANAGFLRSGATLSIIYVSDENDCTDRGALDGYPDALSCYQNSDELVPIRDLIEEHEDLKSNGDRILISAIVGPEIDQNCDGATPGFRYQAMASAFGGIEASICQASFASIMTELGLQASGVMSAFQLSYDAVEDTIEVYVSSTEVPGEVVELPGDNEHTWVQVPQSDTDGWSYDDEYAVLRFHGTAVPPRDAIVKVNYEIVPGSPGYTDTGSTAVLPE